MSKLAEQFDLQVAKVLDSLNEQTGPRNTLTMIPIMCAGLTLLGQLVVAVACVADAVNECDLSLDRLQNRMSDR